MADTGQPGVVAVVGTGLIGRAWAVVFARAGWTVRLSDPHGPTLDGAPALIRDELQALHAHGLAASRPARAGATSAWRRSWRTSGGSSRSPDRHRAMTG